MANNLQEYAAIKGKIKALEQQLEELKPYVMDEVESNGHNGKSLETSFGTFVVMEKRTYEYPEDIIQEENALKLKKKQYEHSPKAILKNVIGYPVFYENKE